MTGKQLKNSILQWAIQGKLVPQDPNDEPASVLLERIRAEKAQLIKEGKIKKDKNESIIYRGDDNSYYEKFLATGEVKCIDDEIPFEIPDTWEWCRVSSLFQINPKVIADDNANAAFVPMEAISAGYGSEFRYYEKKWSEIKTGYTSFADNDIAFAKITPCFQNRKSAIFKELPNGIGAGTTELKILRTFGETMNRWFVLYFLESSYFIDEATFKGTANQQRIVVGYLENKLFPVPPLAEQERIVERIGTIMPIIDKYSNSQERLNKINAKLKESLKKSILQDAIQGKLVPQLPEEGAAQELLEQIRNEKQILIKEGKLKKSDLTGSFIYKGDDNKYYENNSGKIICIDDEIPFEIPSSWAWVRLGCIYNTTSGGTPEKGHPEYYCGGNILWAKVGDLKEWHITDVEERITQIGLDSSSAKLFPTGTLLVAMYCNDAIGKSSIIDVPMSTNQAICGLYPNPYIVTEYVYYVITANKSTLQEKSAGGAQKNINQKIINQLLIPLPPVKEQQRIVNKILNVTSIMSRWVKNAWI